MTCGKYEVELFSLSFLYYMIPQKNTTGEIGHKTNIHLNLWISERPGYSFMAQVVDRIAFLTRDEILSAASSDGKIHFQRCMSGDIKLIPMQWQVSSFQNSRDIVCLKIETVLNRAQLLPKFFAGIKQTEKIEDIQIGRRWESDDSDLRLQRIQSTKTTIGGILRWIKNAFRKNDQVSKVDELFTGDRMLLHFKDDSLAYSVTVWAVGSIYVEKIWMCALCNITYNKTNPKTGEHTEVSQEGILSLPIQIDAPLTFKVDRLKVPELHKELSTIYIKRRSQETTQ